MAAGDSIVPCRLLKLTPPKPHIIKRHPSETPTAPISKVETMQPEQRTVGNVTFAHIDTPSDRWLWSIVQEYKGPQDYGDIICCFEDGGEPEPEHLELMLQALNT